MNFIFIILIALFYALICTLAKKGDGKWKKKKKKRLQLSDAELKIRKKKRFVYILYIKFFWLVY
jgi:hypothetical protein